MRKPSQLLKFTQVCMRLATEQVLPYRFHTLTGDKGYDDRSYRSRLRSIKHREFKPYDRAANARMDPELYHRRSLVETVISVLKRKYGAAVSSRVGRRQFRELGALCWVYNVERAGKRGGPPWIGCCPDCYPPFSGGFLQNPQTSTSGPSHRV